MSMWKLPNLVRSTTQDLKTGVFRIELDMQKTIILGLIELHFYASVLDRIYSVVDTRLGTIYDKDYSLTRDNRELKFCIRCNWEILIEKARKSSNKDYLKYLLNYAINGDLAVTPLDENYYLKYPSSSDSYEYEQFNE
jgi:hypothetical protein